ncbi:MAG: hypothetical protein V7L20_31950 [Nostoc sp.]
MSAVETQCIALYWGLGRDLLNILYPPSPSKVLNADLRRLDLCACPSRILSSSLSSEV